MKILYLITKSEVGGAQTNVYQLCNYFRNNHDVTVVARPGGWLEEKCNELGVRFVPNTFFSNSLNPLNVVRSYLEIKKIIKKIAPDLVHCHSSVAGFLGRLVVRNKIPTVFTAHGWGFNTRVPFFQKWVAIVAEKIVSRYAKKIICVSLFVKNLGLRYCIAPEEKFKLIYNGIETRKMGEKKDGVCNIIFIGRLAAPKQPLLLLEAVKNLDKQIQQHVHVDIVGDGPQKEALEKFINEYDLSSRVTLCGELKRDDVFARLCTSDVFVLLSEWEGFPLSILEAMSVGLPVIVSDVGGISEGVQDGVNGFLLKERTVGDLTDYLTILVKNKELRKKMGDNAHYSVKKFSVDTMLSQTEKVYRDLWT